MAQLDLASIVETPHTLRDTDGRIYDVPTAAMLSTIQIAQMRRLQQTLPEMMAALDTPGGDSSAAVVSLNQVVDEYVQLIAPTMPGERIAAMPVGKKVQIIKWWQDVETPKTPPKATASPRVIRGRRSRGSAASTPASDLKAS
jgi:hypothetical protein